MRSTRTGFRAETRNATRANEFRAEFPLSKEGKGRGVPLPTFEIVQGKKFRKQTSYPCWLEGKKKKKLVQEWISHEFRDDWNFEKVKEKIS